ncbi:MAG: hypothetical protein L0H63_09345 [Nitrococcus sp.]|nr:hypothetical protein [Nitrococcus sp.]
MSSLLDYVREIVMLTERVGELRQDVRGLAAEVENTRERLIVIETLIESATGRQLPRLGRQI